MVLFFCFEVQEVPVVILVAAVASVESNTDPIKAAANTSAFVFFIFSHILKFIRGKGSIFVGALPMRLTLGVKGWKYEERGG